jgi:hypothetical protein
MSDIKGREFIDNADIPWEELGGGLKRKIMAYDDNLMMVKVAFEKGGIGALHSHFHTQMSYVESGKFEITIGPKTGILSGRTWFTAHYAWKRECWWIFSILCVPILLKLR